MRQPPQGRGAERDPDRRAPARAPGARRLELGALRARQDAGRPAHSSRGTANLLPDAAYRGNPRHGGRIVPVRQRLGPGARRRSRRERLPDEAQDLRARPLRDRLEAAQLEPRQLDAPLGSHRLGSRSRTGSRAGRRCGGRRSARAPTPPRDSGRRTSPARSPSCPARRRSRPGRATAAPTGLARSSEYAHVTSTASSDGGPAGSSQARGKSSAGPYCIEPITVPSSSR